MRLSYKDRQNRCTGTAWQETTVLRAICGCSFQCCYVKTQIKKPGGHPQAVIVSTELMGRRKLSARWGSSRANMVGKEKESEGSFREVQKCGVVSISILVYVRV